MTSQLIRQWHCGPIPSVPPFVHSCRKTHRHSQLPIIHERSALPIGRLQLAKVKSVPLSVTEALPCKINLQTVGEPHPRDDASLAPSATDTHSRDARQHITPAQHA
jgi:hypothetical protein